MKNASDTGSWRDPARVQKISKARWMYHGWIPQQSALKRPVSRAVELSCNGDPRMVAMPEQGISAKES